MGKTVVVSWGTQDEAIPNAASFTSYAVAILGSDGVTPVQAASEPLGSTQHSFLGVMPGDYVASVALVDANGNQAAPPVTQAFTVAATPTAPVPVTVAVSM
jgi:hypothetical protein